MSLYRRVLALGRPQLGRLLLSNALRVSTTAGDVALLALLKRAVDDGLLASGASRLGWLLAAAVGVAVLREGAAWFGGRWAVHAATRLIGDIQDRLYAHLQALSLDFHDRNRPGDLMARLFHDVERMTNLVTGVAATALEMPVRLVALFALMASLHPRMALFTAAMMVPIVVLARFVGRRLRRGFRDLNDDLARLYEAAHESLSAAELVRSHHREGDETAAFRAANEVLVARQAQLYATQAQQGPIVQLLRLTALFAAFGYAGREIVAGTLTPGGFVTFLVTAYAFLGSLDALAGLYSIAQGGLACAERVFAVLDERPRVAAPVAGRPARFENALRFETATFAPAGRGPALSEVSVAVHPGERIAIVGASGSGKTTLVRLATRLQDPTAGRLTLDGTDLREIDLAGLRALFATVPQDAPLLDRSIAENIAYGRIGATAAQIEAAAERAGLRDVLGRLPAGLATRVGARGVALSGGERQRIAVARALVREAPIMILDEALASLDPRTEHDVQDALLDVTRSRTLIVISHRLWSVCGFPRILVLEGGRLVGDGDHDTLLRECEAYARAWAAQGALPPPPMARSGGGMR